MSIRIRVILPYFLLTLVVALTGAYVVTKLVTDSLSERLHNQLLESGRVVSDSFARQEIQNIDDGRIIIYTRGVADALREADASALNTLVTPTSVGIGLENVVIVNMKGQELLHLHIQADGAVSNVTQSGKNTDIAPIQALLDDPNPKNKPVRTISKDSVNDRWYYFTALPFVENDEMIGVVAIGTPLDTIMPLLRSMALADVIIYRDTGQSFASTFQVLSKDESIFLETMSIPVATFQEVVAAEGFVLGENVTIEERSYSILYGKLQVETDLLGIFAVVLPADYVVQTSLVNRNLYVVIFSAAMAIVVLLGYIIARRIIDPLSSLVQTSQAITAGDLSIRTSIRSKDEIGALAATFDEMTVSLQERTDELERTNRILEKMDETKSSFIKISGHELRTPLTLIQGYTYMLQMMAEKYPELEDISNGFMGGFNRMEDVVNSMLDVSNIEEKTLALSKKNLQLSTVIARAYKHFELALEERKLQFEIEGVDELPVIQADVELLYKVFYHVIMNAIKYTPDGGHIWVAGTYIENTDNGPEVEITIQDTGIGIDPQNHELVFENFYQTGDVMLHSSGKTKFKGGGPGLGLAIARGVVNKHGGRIWLNSPGYSEETNPGTTVYIRLPVGEQVS